MTIVLKDVLSYTLFLLIPLFVALTSGNPDQQNSSRAATTHHPETEHNPHQRPYRQRKLDPDWTQAQGITVFYQPKIDLENEQPTSFEALIRWRKNGTGIDPNDFISIAEESGLMDKMSLYVLDKVCIFLAKFQGHNLQVLPISVNMPPIPLNKLNIVETIDPIVKRHHVDHRLIEFESTETTAMKNAHHTLAVRASGKHTETAKKDTVRCK